MASNPVVWFEIYVRDMARAKVFYEGLLDVKLQPMAMPDIEMWAFPMDQGAPGAGGALIRMEGVEPGMGGCLVYFSCADCAVEAQRAASHGGSIFKPKTSIGEHGFFALVNDTEGNLVGLYSMA
jgi:predicted enzyme related to lactoylglutathione lyase